MYINGRIIRWLKFSMEKGSSNKSRTCQREQSLDRKFQFSERAWFVVTDFSVLQKATKIKGCRD